MDPHQILPELRRRRVVRVAVVYVAAGLGMIYAADAVLPRLGLPDSAVTFVIVLVGLGFPLAVALAWAFDVTPEGLVRTEALSVEQRSGPSAAADSAPATDRPGIVVLPFDDMSPGGDHEYFSYGLTEEIIADLAGVKALRVISRTSAMRLRGTDKGVPAIGRELDVRYVLEGSVRVAGTSLRITAQLIDAARDEHLWAERYDGTIDDVFALQERVARKIVGALDVTLTSEEEDQLSHRVIEDVRAFQWYLRAREQLSRLSTEGVSELLAQAIEIEGETPPLRALRAWADVNNVRSGRNRDMAPLDRAELEGRELVRIAPDRSYGYALLGYIAWERGDHPAAVKRFRAALVREPNDADVLFYMTSAYLLSGQIDRARETARQFIEYDPLSPLAQASSAFASWFDGQRDEGVAGVERALALDLENMFVRWTAGYAYASLGRLEEAEVHARYLRERVPLVPYTIQLTALLEALNGRPERALEVLSAVDTTPLDAHHTFHLAEPFAMAGKTGRALELVGGAVDAGFYPYRFLAEYCPFMEPLRSTAEFEVVLERAKRRADAFVDARISAPRRSAVSPSASP